MEQDGAVRSRYLTARVVDELGRSFRQRAVARVRRDADDFHRRRRLSIDQAEAHADCVAAGPVSGSKGLIDDRHGGGVGRIRAAESAALDDCDAERVEVAFVHARRSDMHRLDTCRELVAVRDDRSVLDADAVEGD